MAAPDTIIRPHTHEDTAKLHAIRIAAFAPVFASFRAILGEEIAAIALATAEAEQAALLDRMLAEAHVFVAARAGAPIGFASVILDRAQQIGELGLNAVAPSEAGRGVGAALYAHALGYMRSEGMRIAFVGAGADASHAPALRAYAKAGFHAGIPSLTMYQAL